MNYPMAFVGQYVAIMNNFFLNLSTIQNKTYQRDFYQKFNFCLQFIFAVISFIMFGLVFLFLQSNLMDKVSQKQNKTQKRIWFSCCLCNTVIPSLSVFDNLILFYLINLVIFIYDTYSAIKSKKFRLNSIVLSFHLIGFHIGFAILLITDALDYSAVYHHAGFCMIIVLFIGAVHELITFFCGLIYDIVMMIWSNAHKIAADRIKSSLQKIINKKIKFKDVQKFSQEPKINIRKIHFYPKKRFLSSAKCQYLIQESKLNLNNAVQKYSKSELKTQSTLQNKEKKIEGIKSRTKVGRINLKRSKKGLNIEILDTKMNKIDSEYDMNYNKSQISQ